MKKLLAGAFFLSAFAGAHAQCVINQSVFTGPNDYGIVPDTIVNLPIAYVGTAYSTDIQFHVDPDTAVTQPFPMTVDIIKVKIDSVTGMPAGFTYTPNPSNGEILTTSHNPPGTGYGCVLLSGNPSAGQETGGPNSDGIYPLVVHYTGTAMVFNTPTAVPATQTGYRIHIMPASGLKDEELNRFSVTAPMPNPTSGKTKFEFNTLQGGEVEFMLYNTLGSLVKKETIKAEKGINTYQLDASVLAPGMYVYSLRQGGAVLTRRMTVTH